jgi:hypothetical protein
MIALNKNNQCLFSGVKDKSAQMGCPPMGRHQHISEMERWYKQVHAQSVNTARKTKKSVKKRKWTESNRGAGDMEIDEEGKYFIESKGGIVVENLPLTIVTQVQLIIIIIWRANHPSSQHMLNNEGCSSTWSNRRHVKAHYAANIRLMSDHGAQLRSNECWFLWREENQRTR